jgi:DNA end-binding protein Ku
MVSIPVRLFAATEDKDVSFHQLHKEDHSRIRYKKWCPEDDEEVPQDEIVRAYEVAKDKYVELTDEDLDKLPLPSKHTIELSAFVQADEIDPIYYQKTYYLEPEETGRKPYALLVKVLESKGATGVAKIALRNKEHLCALRPVEGSLILETLHYPDEIREHEESPPKVTVNEREVAMAGSLVDALTEPFDPSKYHDNYREAVLELIDSKTEGREVVEPEGSEPGKVTDLMAALRASVESARKGGGSAKASAGHTAKPKSKAKPKTTATKKRKSAA